MRISFCVGLALALAAGDAAAATFTDVGVPNGSLTSLSRNGRIAAGVTRAARSSAGTRTAAP